MWRRIYLPLAFVIAVVFIGLSLQFIPSRSPHSALSVVGGIAMFALVSHIALPQVIAVLALREQATHVATAVVDDWRFGIVLLGLLVSVLAIITASIAVDRSNVTFLLAVLRRKGMLPSRELCLGCLFAWSIISMSAFAIYLSWLLPRVSSRRGVVEMLYQRLGKAIDIEDLDRARIELEHLTAIGCDSQSDDTIMAVVEKQIEAGRSAMDTTASFANRMLSYVVRDICRVVNTSSHDTDVVSARAAIDGLMDLLRDFDRSSFDDDRFVRAISIITQHAITIHAVQVFAIGIERMKDLAVARLRGDGVPWIGIPRLAHELADIGVMCGIQHLHSDVTYVIVCLMEMRDGLDNGRAVRPEHRGLLAWSTFRVCKAALDSLGTKAVVPECLSKAVVSVSGQCYEALDYAERLEIPERYETVSTVVRYAHKMFGPSLVCLAGCKHLVGCLGSG